MSNTKSGRPDGSVIAIDLGVSTAYAVGGNRTVLVDSGPASCKQRLLRRLARAGVEPASISLIVLTHCHPDHAGAAAALRTELGVPIAVHRAEAEWAERGRSEFFAPIRVFGHLLAHTLKPTFPAFTPDLLLDHGTDLGDYGAPLTVLHTPGHTPGSITLLHRPDRDAMVGDLLAGGMFRRNRPNLPFLAQDTDQITLSTHALLAAAPRRLLFGHGKPASALSTLRRFGPMTGPSITSATLQGAPS